MTEQSQNVVTKSDANENISEPELSDADILDAMLHIPGYIDISMQDFREIYHLAHHHALERLWSGTTASCLMRNGITPIRHNIMLDQAAKTFVELGYKCLPVVDEHDSIIGMLTESDFLAQLNVDSFLELLLKMFDNGFEVSHRFHQTLVRDAMSTPVVCIRQDAGFIEMLEKFHLHSGRSMPVVNNDGQLKGLILRKDFIKAFRLSEEK